MRDEWNLKKRCQMPLWHIYYTTPMADMNL